MFKNSDKRKPLKINVQKNKYVAKKHIQQYETKKHHVAIV